MIRIIKVIIDDVTLTTIIDVINYHNFGVLGGMRKREGGRNEKCFPFFPSQTLWDIVGHADK